VVIGFTIDFTVPGADWVTSVVRWTSDYLAAEYAKLDLSRVPVAALQYIEVSAAGESVVDVVTL
jgi:hypothetical protein